MFPTRNKKVENLFLSALNKQAASHNLEFHLQDPVRPSDGTTYEPVAIFDNARPLSSAVMWHEWQGVYIVCATNQRGMYLKWKIDGENVLLTLDIETTDNSPFLALEEFSQSPNFITLFENILQNGETKS